MSAWLKHDTIATSSDFILTKASFNGDDSGYKMYMDSSGEYCVDTDDDATWNPDLNLCTPGGDGIEYDDNEWHHVVFARNGTEKWRVHVDGATLAEGGIVQFDLINSNALHVGMDRDGTTGGWDGQMSDIKIYTNYNFSPAQANYLYNRSKPVVSYGLNECSGTVAHNSTTNNSGGSAGLHGAINIGAYGDNAAAGTCSGGSDEAWANGNPGQVDYSLDFDGSDDYIEIGDQYELDFRAYEDLTIEAWVNRDTFNTNDMIVAKDDSVQTLNDDGYMLYIHVNDAIYFQIGDGGNSCYCLTTGGEYTITSSGWHHIVGTFSRDTDGSDTGAIDVYIDGKGPYCNGPTLNCGADTSNSLPLIIGADSNTPPENHFDGQIDEVKIYNGLSKYL